MIFALLPFFASSPACWSDGWEMRELVTRRRGGAKRTKANDTCILRGFAPQLDTRRKRPGKFAADRHFTSARREKKN